MKRKLLLGSYNIHPFKHAISKFEIAEVKIADFVSAQSWAILPSKMVFESRGQNATRQYPLTSSWCQELQLIMAELRRKNISSSLLLKVSEKLLISESLDMLFPFYNPLRRHERSESKQTFGTNVTSQLGIRPSL